MMVHSYVYMVILEGLANFQGYAFDEHNVIQCFVLKGSTNKCFSLTIRNFMIKVYNLHNKIHYKESQAFEIVGTKLAEGTVPLVH